MRSGIAISRVLATTFAVGVCGAIAQAQLNPSFTYQGQLTDDGSPLTGLCSFQFSLWDGSGDGEPGMQIGATQYVYDHAVANGLFTVEVNSGGEFGPDAFNGQPRWLEITVTVGEGSPVTLSPRQPLTPAPYAFYSASAPWSGLMDAPFPVSCADGQILKWMEVEQRWECAEDEAGSGEFWSLTGNSGTTPGTHFLGTTDNVALELHVNGAAALRLLPDVTSPNLVGGHGDNSVTTGVLGAAIAGGGDSVDFNSVTDHYGFVGGGAHNQAGDDDTTLDDATYATVSGGHRNFAMGMMSTVGGGQSNVAGENRATVAGGDDNHALSPLSTIGGGWENYIWPAANYATIGGGSYNVVQSGAEYATVSGGGPGDPGNPTATHNVVYDHYGTIGGGANNRAGSDDADPATAIYATVSGGKNNIAGWAAAVAGGSNNTADGGNASIGGGNHNSASGSYAVIGGGSSNTASESGTVIGGGYDHEASGAQATIGGGNSNTASGLCATVGGGNLNSASGGCAAIGGGSNNTASGSGTAIGGGYYHEASGEQATIGGGNSNTVSGNYATVGGGRENAVSGVSATVAGGKSNTVSGNYATVGGGQQNAVSGTSATVAGGIGNAATSQYTAMGGGAWNNASGEFATVGGGYTNTAAGNYACIPGGRYNEVQAAYATIGGGGPSDPAGDPSGTNNRVWDDYGTIGGGGGNWAGTDDTDPTSAVFATIAGGKDNLAVGHYSVIGGGNSNQAGTSDPNAPSATVSGGESNNALAAFATIGGGQANTVSQDWSTIAGGVGNSVEGSTASIGGGSLCIARGNGSTVAGGASNLADGHFASIAGGQSNVAVGDYASIPGGQSNEAEAQYSFAAGRRAKARSMGSFVWADSTDADFQDSGPNTFSIRATNGVHVSSNNDWYAGLDVTNVGDGDGIKITASADTGNSNAALYAGNVGSSPAIYAQSVGGQAAYFDGPVTVVGYLSKLGGGFKIDHPLDPRNKYLYHNFVESPEMLNVYNGTAVLDARGQVVVKLPDWFEALNRDFHYQLTCVGGFAPVYIAEEIADNCFTIAGGQPGLKVSWQVTGVRQDDWANANRPPVEVDKPEHERGTRLHAEAHGVSR